MPMLLGVDGCRSLIFDGTQRGWSPEKKMFQHSDEPKPFMEFCDCKDSYSASSRARRIPNPHRWNSAEEEEQGALKNFPSRGDRQSGLGNGL